MANQDISYKEMVNRVNELPINTTISSDFDEIEELYNLLNTLYIKAKIDAVGSTEVNNVDEASKKIKASYDKIDDEISSDKFLTLYSQVIYLSDQLKIEKNFTIISPPIQMVDDLINFKISANPVSTNSLAPHNSKTEFSFDVPSSSGIEVDFSVGPTLSLGKGAKDELYYLEQSTTLGKSYLRQRNNNNDGLPGLAAMMHIYDRVASETAIGLLFGVGAGFQGINDVGLSFYLGGSVILGKKQKVMLNTGVSFLRVNRLKEGEFKVGNEYTTQDFDINNVVEKVYRPSLFISLSYSLTKRVTN